MRIIITRHGETEQNRSKILQGHMDGKLTPEGKEQAKKLGIRLAKEHIDAIYTSDLSRARLTAEAVAMHHPKASLTITKELREVDIGALTGKPYSHLDHHNLPDDYERDELLYARAQKFIHFIIEKHSGQTVLCVAHGRMNRCLIAVLLGHSPEGIDAIAVQHNTSVNILEIDENQQWHAHTLNCIAHLQDSVVLEKEGL